MTTLFPVIKRVDEDETSKIIKNVLIDDQDELKLEHIFDEFMHLTEESITFSDEEEDDEDEDDDEEDDSDDEEEDEEDDDDDSSSGSDESDSSESDEEKKPEPQPEPSHRQPTSWNLDQFIKTIPVTKAKAAASIPSPEDSISAPSSASSIHNQNRLEVEPPTTITKQEPSITKQQEPPRIKQHEAPQISKHEQPSHHHQPQQQQQNTHQPKQRIKNEPIVERELVPERRLSPLESQPTPEPQPTPDLVSKTEPAPSLVPPTKKPLLSHQAAATTNNSNSTTTNSQQPSSSYLVQIDLSKLKRIPTTKVPTPTTTSSNSMMTAKALKHEADAEKDKTKQAIKYLESAMYFVLHGYELEDSRSSHYINDTVPLFKHALRLSMPGSSENQDNMTNLKIHTLALRCLGLLHMKLYKLREREVHENNKVINSPQNNSPVPQADSSLIGIRPQLLSAFKRQLQILSYLRYANDYWQQADHFCDQHPAVRIFFSTIDSNCGTLTMSSPFLKLMDHFKYGLKLLRS